MSEKQQGAGDEPEADRAGLAESSPGLPGAGQDGRFCLVDWGMLSQGCCVTVVHAGYSAGAGLGEDRRAWTVF